MKNPLQAGPPTSAAGATVSAACDSEGAQRSAATVADAASRLRTIQVSPHKRHLASITRYRNVPKNRPVKRADHISLLCTVLYLQQYDCLSCPGKPAGRR